MENVSASLATTREHRLHEHDEYVLIELVCDLLISTRFSHNYFMNLQKVFGNRGMSR